jgi:hypothetical protein
MLDLEEPSHQPTPAQKPFQLLPLQPKDHYQTAQLIIRSYQADVVPRMSVTPLILASVLIVYRTLLQGLPALEHYLGGQNSLLQFTWQLSVTATRPSRLIHIDLRYQYTQWEQHSCSLLHYNNSHYK